MKILVACEESQAVTIALRKLGHEAYSNDLIECSGGYPEWHLQQDTLELLEQEWDMVIAFPPCTYLTCSAEWAYKEPPHHQKLKPGTLFGADRERARIDAVDFVSKIWDCNAKMVAIENPVGKLSSLFQKPNQIINPHEFGDNASKRTCLWLRGLPDLVKTKDVKPRFVNGKPRWANQTDSGQNNLPPTKDRAKLRSKTYAGIARAMAEQWAGKA